MSESVRMRALVAYDGAPFRGFAVNDGVRTVAGDLTAALAQVLGTEVAMTCAGRTDKGVHGWGQVVSFDAPADHPPVAELRRAVDRLCGPAIAVRAVEVAPPGFDARFDAVARVYRYRLVAGPVADPFRRHTHWHVHHDLDLAAMRTGIDPLLGEHDFASFCRRPKAAPGAEPLSLVRRLRRASWSRHDDEMVFEIEASSFCHQMVRSVVGTLVDVGRGRRRAGDMAAVLAARDRSAAGPMAPAHGLMLWHVRYPDPPFASAACR